MKRLVVAGLLLALAAGCAGEAQGTRVHSLVKPRSVSDVPRLVRANPQLTLLGTPPGGATLEQAAAAIRLPAELGGQTPVLVPPDSPERRIVIAFGRASASDLCAGTAGSAARTLIASGAWCRGRIAQSYGVVENPGITSVTDAGFTPAMTIFLRAILVPVPDGGSPR
jgi:hypothetical protein